MPSGGRTLATCRTSSSQTCWPTRSRRQSAPPLKAQVRKITSMALKPRRALLGSLAMSRLLVNASVWRPLTFMETQVIACQLAKVGRAVSRLQWKPGATPSTDLPRGAPPHPSVCAFVSTSGISGLFPGSWNVGFFKSCLTLRGFTIAHRSLVNFLHPRRLRRNGSMLLLIIHASGNHWSMLRPSRNLITRLPRLFLPISFCRMHAHIQGATPHSRQPAV